MMTFPMTVWIYARQESDALKAPFREAGDEVRVIHDQFSLSVMIERFAEYDAGRPPAASKIIDLSTGEVLFNTCSLQDEAFIALHHWPKREAALRKLRRKRARKRKTKAP